MTHAASPNDPHHGFGSDAPTTAEDYMLRTLAVFAPDNNNAISWRLDGAYAPITFIAECNDLFYWGTSDGETILMADVPLLEQSAADVLRTGADIGWTAELYAARKRGMRPQGAMYQRIPEALHTCFDDAGPSRQADISNPRPHPDDKTIPPAP